MKKIIFLSLLFSALLFTSCTKEDVDVRDQYTGYWSGDENGSLRLLYNGSIVGTVPIEQSGRIYIRPATDETKLSIDNESVTLSGGSLIFNQMTITEIENGITMQLNISRTGTINKTTIVVKSTYSGTFQGNGASGIIAGSSSSTFIKD